MNDKLLAYLDAIDGRLAQQRDALEKQREGQQAQRALADSPDFLAHLRPGSRGTLTGPWVTMTCPHGHPIGPVRAVRMGDRNGYVQLLGGQKLQTRTEVVGGQFMRFGPSDEAKSPQGPWMTQRRRWTCPVSRCGWQGTVSEVALIRTYVAALGRGEQRASLD